MRLTSSQATMLRLLALALVLSLPLPTFAQAPDLAREVSQSLQSKQVKLKVPASGGRLKFDANGSRLKGNTGLYGLDDSVQITSAELRERELRIKGTRLITLLDTRTSEITFGPSDPVDVRIEFPIGQLEFSAIESALANIFATPADVEARTCSEDEAARFRMRSQKHDHATLTKSLPEKSETMCLPSGGRGYLVSKNLRPPKAVSTPDPQFPEELRKGNVRAMLIELYARIDENGRITDILPKDRPSLADAISAIAVLRNWRFKPATLEGKPIPIIINIEMNLKLY